MELCLDVGCGPYKRQGSIGVDRFLVDNVDVVCDLNKPWPFDRGVFDRIVFSHSINHLEDLGVTLSEAVRVSKSGAIIEIIAPHFSSDNIFTDPTVKFFTGYRTLNYYCKNMKTRYSYYSGLNLLLQKRWIYLFKSQPKNSLEKWIYAFIYPIEFLINQCPRVYEKFFCFIIRANEISYVLKVE